MRLVAVIVALAIATPAAAGWVRLSWSPSPGATAIRSGCVAQAQYERPLVPIAGSSPGSATIEGLPDSGRCYFALNGGPQDEWAYDFTALAGGVAAPGAIRNLVVTPVAAPPPPPPSVFQTADVGAPLAGSFAELNGTYTLRGAGADIWGTADQFRYAYATLTGDGEITARVASVVNTHAWAKAGVMIRETVQPSSRYAFMFVSASNGVDFQWRATASAQQAGGDGVTRTPRWVRLTRTGNVFRGYHSADGAIWMLYSTQTVTMAANVTVGLAVTSHNAAALTTAVFTDVQVVE